MPVPAGGDGVTLDLIATTSDLAAFLQIDEADLNTATATLLLEGATAAVQEAAGGQRIVEASGTYTLSAPSARELWLPQIPAQSVDTVLVDDVELDADSWVLRGNQLRRSYGWWQEVLDGEVTVTYTHGYPDGDQRLQLARRTVLMLAAASYTNPTGAVREQLDDYATAYEAASQRLDESPYLVRQILRTYGRSAGLITVGT